VLNIEDLVRDLKDALKGDLINFYESLSGDYEDLVEDLYFYIISSNPKFYPISGLQHYLGSGFLALRLAQHQKLDNRSATIAFLSGLLHDLNKWPISEDKVRELFRRTSLYNRLTDRFSEEHVGSIFEEAVTIAKTLERGGTPRHLQRIAELVRAADYITGNEDSWNLNNVIKILQDLLKIYDANLYPVLLGKQRPLSTLLSSIVKSELHNKINLIPLISLPEGMLFLNPFTTSPAIADAVYDRLADEISKMSTEDEGGSTKSLNVMKFVKALREGKLFGLSKAYGALSAYTERAIISEFNKVKNIPADLRGFITLLAYLRYKTKNDESVIDELAKILKIKISGKGVTEKLRNFHKELERFNGQELINLGEMVLRVIKDDLQRIRKIENGDALKTKISFYISLPTLSTARIAESKGISRTPKKVEKCAVCGEEVISHPKTLQNFLSELTKILGRDLNTSEIFSPGILAAPEKRESIGDVTKKLKICEICYFEASSLASKLGFFDGMWASVLIYYPNLPIDLIEVIAESIESIRGGVDKVVVLPDYISSRIVVGIGGRGRSLEKNMLLEALRLWYVFGGNLAITKNPLSAFTWSGAPIQFDVNDVVFSECCSEYLKILNKARDKASYLRFTAQLRYWLYKSLSMYVENLERKTSSSRATELIFTRTNTLITGFCSLDSALEAIGKG
jgi:hypothetical protein